MSDVVSSARAARERLAQGLGALQGPGVPEHLITVAEPIARAMGALHRIESSGGQAVREAGPMALDAVRTALGMLQAQTISHPSVDAALEAVAGSLGMVHGLVKVTSAPPPQAPAPQAPAPQAPAPQAPAPQAPQVQAPRPASGPPRPASTPPRPAGPAAAPQPTAGVAFAATALASGPMGLGATAPLVPKTSPQPQLSVPVDVTVASAGAPRPILANIPGPDSAFAPNSTLQSHGADRPPPLEPSGVGGSPYTAAATQPEAKPLPAPLPGQLRLEAALGAHSPTNFYKGLSGNDVVDAGGIFIATYQIPRIGTPLSLKLSLPGGYEFEAQAIVHWTREPASVSDGSQPGFGAQFTSISPEGRQLVYRYVRNREPLFHDDL